jgi:hypothetical protein
VAEKQNNSVPVDIVSNLRNQGYSNSQIIENLRKQSYSLQDISDAMNQSEIRSAIDQPSDIDLPPPPSPSGSRENLDFPGPSSSREMDAIASSGPYSQDVQPMSRQVPEYQNYVGVPQRDSYTEKIEEITESIIKEKWEDFVKEMGDINIWKEKVRNDILSIKQELIRTQERFENLQRAVVGKVSEYDKDIREVGTEIKALEKVLERIIDPLTSNIRDLQKVTDELKTKRKK